MNKAEPRSPGDAVAARLTPNDGADAARRAIGPADSHPLSVRRCAPAIQRLQLTGLRSSKLSLQPAADPPARYLRTGKGKAGMHYYLLLPPVKKFTNFTGMALYQFSNEHKGFQCLDGKKTGCTTRV